MDWVKIMCNILDHRKIKMIRKGPEGNTLVLLWLLMLAEGGKCNRGGYLMVSNTLPYTPETISMVTDIPLPTVLLGLSTFAGLDMIDRNDTAIFIKNWGRYQSEDKLEARRDKERIRQQRHRQKVREKICALVPEHESRDSNANMSRDVTLENRQDNRRVEKTITDDVRTLLFGTPLSKVSDKDLQDMQKKYGLEKLMKSADVATETLRRSCEKIDNPGGYLQTFCASLKIPNWYVPFTEREVHANELSQRKLLENVDQAAIDVQEEEQAVARNLLWESLSEKQKKGFCIEAVVGIPEDLVPNVPVTLIAKLLAWEANKTESQLIQPTK